MPLSGFYRQIANIIRRGTRAAQPAATDVLPGGLYFVTDENEMERSTGSAWESVSTGPTEQTTTSTGTQNNVDLSGRHTLLRCNNSSALVITGFTTNGAAPVGGDRVTVTNIGSSTVRIAHQDTGSTAANRVIGESARGQIVGAGGSISLVYDTTTDRWRITSVAPGASIAVPFNAGDFTGSGSMTWTVASGDVTAYQYLQQGRLVTLWIEITTTTVGGTPSTQLQVLIPNSFTVNVQNSAMGFLQDNAVNTVGFCFMVPSQSTTLLKIARLDFGNFSAATDTTRVGFQIQIEVD